MSSENNSPHPPRPDVALDRYLAGITSDEERARLEHWWRAASVQDKVEGVLRAPTLRPDVDPRYAASAWARIQRHVTALPLAPLHEDGQPGHERVARFGARARESASRSWLLALGKMSLRHAPMSLRVITVGGIGLTVAAGLLLVALPNRLARRGVTDVMRHYTTTVGQRATITLADGAKITLAPQTTLRVPSAFGRTTRTVWLDGEAYFDVPHVSSMPFIVQTGVIRTQVLGTAFDIRRYRDDRAVQVAVVTGKVAVTAATSQRASVTLSAGRVGVVTDSTATAATASDMAPFTGWVNGHLVFERTPVRDVLAAVGRWYGYEFRLSDSVLATRYLSASFDHQSSADVLDALKTVLHVTMTFDGNVVTLHPQPQQAATPNDKRRRTTEFLHSREVGR